MKIKIKKNYLIWTLLSTFLIIWIINITNGQVIINTNPDISKLHTPSLFSLFLGDNNSNSAQIKVNSWKNYLEILTWLIVWSQNQTNSSAQLSVIWWWELNVMNASNAWIGWWKSNKIEIWDYWAIWWWESNQIWPSKIGWNWKNWIIVWWKNNTANGWWIILWWELNQISKDKIWWIILWWYNNLAWNNSLILWSNSIWWEYAFIWNLNNRKSKLPEETNTAYSARINANSWMLIWTYKPITWVSLVVSWSIKLWSSNVNNTWWIYIDSNNCIKFYDWSTSNTLGKVSEYDTKCLNRWCNFGITSLHNWDKVVAYSKSYATKCDDIKQIITCNNWELVDQNNWTGIYIYPYCYDLSPDPSIKVKEWKQNCPKLVIENAIYLNPYFTQKLNKNTNEYTPKNGSIIYDPTWQKDCSFTCKENFEWNKDHRKCYWKTRSQSCSWSLPDNTFYDKNIFTQQWDWFKRSPEEVMERHFAENYSWQPCEFTCKENYEWNNSTKTCEAKDLECRNKPRWSDYSGYILWSSTYKYGYTPTSWTHTENNNPWTCQFTCKTNYKYITWTNTCEPKTLDCAWSKPSWSGYILWSDQYIYWTINKTSWNYTGNSDPLSCQYTCDTANWYTWNSANNKCIGNTRTWECQWLPNNAHWINSWFTQTFDGNNWTPSNIELTNTWNSSVECSYRCNSGYSKDGNGCTQTPKCWYYTTEDWCKFWEKFKENYSNNWQVITRFCKNWSINSSKCYCEIDNEDGCPEDYKRDSINKKCKFYPKFCIYEYYSNNTRSYLEYTWNKYHYYCFDKEYPIPNNSTVDQGHRSIPDGRKVRPSRMIPGLDTNIWFMWSLYTDDYHNSGKSYIYSYGEPLNIDKIEWIDKKYAEGYLHGLIDNGKCTIKEYQWGNNWVYLDCDIDAEESSYFFKDIKKYNYKYCSE